jgi:hypothetical protein
MRDHADAIEYLRARGVPASRRVWSLGDTIVVPFEPSRVEHEGAIVTYRFIVWLAPAAGGSWDLLQPVSQFLRRVSFDSLERACEGALRILSLQEPTDACPGCGGRRRVSFGDRIRHGELSWFRGTICEGCGARTEADGGDRLPDDLRAMELARNGVWGVFVSRAPEASGWIAIRKALGLDLAAVSALKDRIPCVAFEGTIAEASGVCELFVTNGASAELKEVHRDSGRI